MLVETRVSQAIGKARPMPQTREPAAVLGTGAVAEGWQPLLCQPRSGLGEYASGLMSRTLTQGRTGFRLRTRAGGNNIVTGMEAPIAESALPGSGLLDELASPGVGLPASFRGPSPLRYPELPVCHTRPNCLRDDADYRGIDHNLQLTERRAQRREGGRLAVQLGSEHQTFGIWRPGDYGQYWS
jgi:hypothetical protein